MTAYSYPDPMADFFLSGKAHVYYGLIAAGLLSALVLFGASTIWLIAVLMILAAIFTDLWAHWYAH